MSSRPGRASSPITASVARHVVATPTSGVSDRELPDSEQLRDSTWYSKVVLNRPISRCGGTPNAKKPAALQLVSSTGATGLEPATSGVTGRRSNQLSYAP